MAAHTNERLRTRIGYRLMRRRQEMRFTAIHLSKLSGVHINSIYQAEAGAHTPTVENLWRLCNILEITMDSLLRDNGPQRMQSDSTGGPDDVRNLSPGVGLQRFGPSRVQPESEPLYKMRNGTVGR